MPKYYCDYCERSFNDTPEARKQHFESVRHRMQVKLHYDSFGDVRQGERPQRSEPPLSPVAQDSSQAERCMQQLLPPSMQPPPGGGHDFSGVLDWG
ncbi:Zinc finger matrin-type protein 5 [Balamuthia mandrillaris]